jgi:hypothetical protein
MADIENYGQCELVCFIKEIRRARKKWFFITLEDVTWVIDVFLKEKLDYKVFDVVIVSAYKWHRLSVNRIETVDLQALRNEVKRKWLYDETKTASYVKMMRNKTLDKEDNADESLLSVSSSVTVSDWEDLSVEDDNDESLDTIAPVLLDFVMPDTIPWMVAVRKILSEHPWDDHQITLSRKSYTISTTWLEKLRSYLAG